MDRYTPYMHVCTYICTCAPRSTGREVRTVVAQPLPGHPHDGVDRRVVFGAVGGREAGVLVHLKTCGRRGSGGGSHCCGVISFLLLCERSSPADLIMRTRVLHDGHSFIYLARPLVAVVVPVQRQVDAVRHQQILQGRLLWFKNWGILSFIMFFF